MYDKDGFDPNNVDKKEMIKLADHIEEYLDLFKEVMIIPDEIYREHGDKIKESIKRTEQLIKKLRKGDRSVFKDLDDDNPF